LYIKYVDKYKNYENIDCKNYEKLLFLSVGCTVGQNNFTWRECSFGLQEYEHQILFLG